MFKCNECDKEFKSQKGLNAHQIAHKSGPRYSVLREHTKTINEKTYACKTCKNDNKWRHSQKNIYCSVACQQTDGYNNRIKLWKDTDKIGIGTVKKYLAEQKEGCWECGITSWNNKSIVLELEHIDGNSDNNKEDNLSLICPNCHSQTSTYKGKNKGNGRHTRMKRYHAGKSY